LVSVTVLAMVAVLVPSVAPASATEVTGSAAVVPVDPVERPPLSDPVTGPEVGEEIAGLRTAHSRTVLAKDGFRTTVSSAAMNFEDADGRWQPIDERLVATRDGGWRNAANRFSVSLPATLSDPVTIATGGAALSVRLDGADRDVEGEADGSTVTYRGALPGVDVEYVSLADGLKETLVLEDAAAPHRFNFTAATSRASLSGSTIGLVKASDGETAFVLPPAFAVDAAGVSSAVEMDIADGSVSLSLDEAWLESPDRVWPVRVDPTATLASTDCGIVSNVTTPICSNASMDVGNAGSVVSRGLVRFDQLVYDVPREAVITNADLELTVTGVANATSTQIDVHPLTGEWDTCPTWTLRYGSDPWDSPGGDYDSASTVSIPNAASTGTKTWNVTEMLAKSRVGDVEDFGFLLRAANESAGNVITFGTNESSTSTDRPELVVDWHWPEGRAPWTTQVYEHSLSDRASVTVDAAGHLVVTDNVVHIPGTGLDTALTVAFSSWNHYDYSPMVEGWDITGSYGPQLHDHETRAVLESPDRGEFVFPKNPDGTYQDAAGLGATLTRDVDGITYHLHFHETAEAWTMVDHYSDGLAVLTKVQDRNGNHTDVNFASSGTMRDGTKAATGITDSRGRTVTIGRDTSARIATISDDDDGNPSTAARTTTFTYSGDHVADIEDSLGKHLSFSYDSQSNLTRITNGRGYDIVIDYTNPYDGLVASITNVTYAPNDSGPTWSFDSGGWFHDSADDDNLVADMVVTDARGEDWTYRRDPRGRVHQVTDPLGHAKATSFTLNNDVSSAVDALSAESTYSYNTDNLLTSLVGPTGSTRTWNYNTSGQPYRASSAVGSDGYCASFGYDSVGNMTDTYAGMTPSGTPANCDGSTSGDRSQQSYNTGTGNGTYGTVASSTDPNGNVTSYSYNSLGELTGIDHPAPLGDESFTYDAVSRVKTHTDGKGQVATFSYDKADRVTKILYNGASSCGWLSADCVTYSYDNDGNISQRQDNTGLTFWYYDQLDLLTAYQLPNNVNACSGGNTVNTDYDPNGNLDTYCDAGGSTHYGYDAANRMTTMEEPGGSCTAPESKCTHFGYDDADRRTSTQFPTSPAVTQSTTYDDAGKPLEITAVRAGSPATTLTDWTYTYLHPGGGSADTELRASQTDVLTSSTTSYSYDSFARLTGADAPGSSDDQTYSYDPNGNRLTKVVGGTTTTYAYNAADQLCWSVTATSANPCATTPTGATTYSFDANGSQTADSTGWSASYTHKDQTASITPAGGTALNFTYQDTTSTNRTAAGSLTFDNTQVGLAREVDTASSTTTYYLRTPAGGVVGQNRAGTRHYYLTDALGSVIGLIDTNGAVASTYSYDPWGVITATTGTVVNPYRYAGGYHDTATGLTKFGTRYYNPEIGRWTQRDPAGGGANPYAYSGNSPSTLTDRTGYIFGYSWDDFTEDLGTIAEPLGAAVGAVGSCFAAGDAATVIATTGAALAGFTAGTSAVIGAVGGAAACFTSGYLSLKVPGYDFPA
jgi:RHS repeat-associated protein